jgi:enamine deaminase RidA (YjgF/YER057c/UK114 family)
MNPDQRFEQFARELGYAFDGDIKIGGHYVPLLRHGHQIFVSGQIPRVGDQVVVTGRAGDGATLEPARLAARVCTMRALALLQRHLGSLEQVRAILRITVFVQCSASFTQQSEVADAASDLLYFVFGERGAHSRTSVGVQQLPKNATVELDLIAAAD